MYFRENGGYRENIRGCRDIDGKRISITGNSKGGAFQARVSTSPAIHIEATVVTRRHDQCYRLQSAQHPYRQRNSHPVTITGPTCDILANAKKRWTGQAGRRNILIAISEHERKRKKKKEKNRPTAESDRCRVRGCDGETANRNVISAGYRKRKMEKENHENK